MKARAEDLKLAKKRKILQISLSHFSKLHFEEVSLRKIAAEVEISVGNLYNYFENKDALFRAVLNPFLRKVAVFKKILLNHSKDDLEDIESDFLFHLELSKKIAKFAYKNRQMIVILLFHSKGSSLADFPDKMINFQTQRFFEEINKKAGSPIFDFFFAHNIVSYFYNTIREAIMHELSPKELEKAIRDMISFTYFGIMGLAQKEFSPEFYKNKS